MYQKYTDSGRQKGIVTLTPNTVDARYIAAERLSTQKICKTLHINRDRPNYDTITAHAIDRLLVLAFGVDGINWNDTNI